MNHVQEAGRIRELVGDALGLEVLSPYKQKSQKFSHLLLVMLHLVDSVNFARGVGHVVIF